MNILLVEDEPNVASFIKRGLEEHSHHVEVAYDGTTGLRLAMNNEYDLCILDIILPYENGYELCKKIREAYGNKVSILMLTALSGTDDVVKGLDTGADDYLPKPFEFKELMARIRSISRRGKDISPNNELKVADLVMNLDTKEVHRGEREISLTSREFHLLELLMRNKGRVLSRVDILENIWDQNYDLRSNVVDVFVNYLRKKVDGDGDKRLIHTVIGMGYVLKEDQ